ncbi:MAG TPA: FIST N-terminal domain-containing protein [Aquabacterium sp.]|uniref:FIST signal transduction protein n=1 Tax=Aquabacterium sp. TaxID=1872578 RepID=UPI002E354EE1|nr:FIST N-terminal domain-containing protein [Aquabacterium sp.]HEX5356671.1 FIST N-terminal domain-containing protein [Aquabacterium sp.]
MTTAPLRFLHAHATHPQPELALELVWAQLASQGASSMNATLGWCYLTEELAEGASTILAGLRERLPHVAWVGGVGSGILATGVEYIDEPALAVMLCNLPGSDFRVFHGRQPLAAIHPLHGHQGQVWRAHTALVHADGHSPDLPELIQELAERTETGFLFGGVSAGQSQSLHLAVDPHAHSSSPDAEDAPPGGVWQGGVSGVAFSDQVRLVTRVTQGCEPIGPQRQVTAAHRNVIYELDGLPALNCLLKDLGVPVTVSESDWQRDALPKVRATLVGLSDEGSNLLSHGQHFAADTRVRHLVGIDPSRYGVAISDLVASGMQLAFCQRHVAAARKDLVRICAEIREEFDPSERPGSAPVGAIYVSCAGRGGPHFGAPHAEMEIIAHALGDIPLVGFFASGEIARHHLYGYTGVLTVFGG